MDTVNITIEFERKLTEAEVDIVKGILTDLESNDHTFDDAQTIEFVDTADDDGYDLLDQLESALDTEAWEGDLPEFTVDVELRE